MAILVSPRFSGSSLRKVSGQWVARESWNVVGTLDKNTAIEAAIPFNTPHGDNPNMKAGHRDASNHKGPLSWIVTADFTFGDHGICADTPLDEPYKIIGEPGSIAVDADRDLNFHPIVNSAGDPFTSASPNFVNIFILRVRTAMPFFPIAVALNATDAVNSDSFTLRGAGGVDVGQCYCRYYKPFEEYTENAPWVWVELCFEFAPNPNPWQVHAIDKGRNGWYGDGTKKGPFCLSTSTGTLPTIVNFDVLLDGTGKPIDPAVKVLDDQGVPQAPVSPATAPAGLQVEATLSSAKQKTLLWVNKRTVPFSGLI